MRVSRGMLYERIKHYWLHPIYERTHCAQLLCHQGDVGIRVPDLVAFIKDGVSPVNPYQQFPLDPELLIGSHQHTCWVFGDFSDQLPASRPKFTSREYAEETLSNVEATWSAFKNQWNIRSVRRQCFPTGVSRRLSAHRKQTADMRGDAKSTYQ